MKKKLIVISLILSLGTLGFADEEKTTEEKTIAKEADWWNEIGKPDSDYWWITEYQDEQSD